MKFNKTYKRILTELDSAHGYLSPGEYDNEKKYYQVGIWFAGGKGEHDDTHITVIKTPEGYVWENVSGEGFKGDYFDVKSAPIKVDTIEQALEQIQMAFKKHPYKIDEVEFFEQDEDGNDIEFVPKPVLYYQL